LSSSYSGSLGLVNEFSDYEPSSSSPADKFDFSEELASLSLVLTS